MNWNVFEWAWVIEFGIAAIVRGYYAIRTGTKATSNVYAAPLDTVLGLLSGIGLGIVPLVYLLSSWLEFADYAVPAWVGWTGAVVYPAGVLLLWRSHADLGVNWSLRVEVREGHTLVTGGVFSRMRHPMYAAHWLLAIGQALLLHNWIAGPALLVPFAPLYFLRAPAEERMMLEQFGDEYRRYMERSGRVLPKRRGPPTDECVPPP